MSCIEDMGSGNELQRQRKGPWNLGEREARKMAPVGRRWGKMWVCSIWRAMLLSLIDCIFFSLLVKAEFIILSPKPFGYKEWFSCFTVKWALIILWRS